MAVILPASEVPGAAQETTSQDILAAVDGVEGLITDTNSKLDTLSATDFATETTSAAIAADVSTLVTNSEQWPYAAHDYISTAFNENTFTEVNTFISGGSGGTPVGTITLVFSDALKSALLSTSYNPAVKAGG